MTKAKRGRPKAYDGDSLLMRSILGVFVMALGVLTGISIVGGLQGSAFAIIRQAMQGLGGSICLVISVLLLWGGFLISFSARHRAPVRPFLLVTACLIMGSGIFNLLSGVVQTQLIVYIQEKNRAAQPLIANPSGYWETLVATYAFCSGNGAFAGALGMVTAWPLWTFVGPTGGVLILGALCLLCVLFLSKFDLVGLGRNWRERTDERIEKREVDRQRRTLQKEMRKQEAQARTQEQQTLTEAQALQTPAYKRRKGKDTEEPAVEPPACAAPPVAMDNPILHSPTPSPAYAPPMQTPAFAGMPYMQAVPPAPFAGTPQMAYPGVGGVGQPIMAGVGGIGQPQAEQEMFDDMIVPELPNGGSTSGWKPKALPGKRGAKPETQPQAPAQAQAQLKAHSPGLFGRDREAERVTERMEENRKRKSEIERELNELGANAAKVAGATAAAQAAVGAAAVPRTGLEGAGAIAGAAFAVGKAVITGAQAASAPITPAQAAYAAQTAAYRPPVNAEPTRASTPLRADSPRHEAYRKPEEERIGQPTYKLPCQQAENDGKPVAKVKKPYPYPMIELLDLRTQAKPDTREQDRANALRLEQTLESFGIPAQVQRVTHGPAVTRFELGLISSGINVKRIMNIADNIALDMASNGGVRIEVPIPGTNLFGVEIPNQEILPVTLAEVLTSQEMTNAKSPLSVALGKDIAGRPVICDLAKMPHLLIAGQTGSGKSVCINAIINSLLFRSSPEEVRMIMIDPKVVELQGYNQVPHLLIPVVSDPQKASGALTWAVNEMLDRYHKMQSKGVRDITAYNLKVVGEEPRLPRIVIIIDELSDLMLACKKEVEESIIRLAQLARAAGIHMVVATQRPTVNVITGLIKANVPSRIAFAVSSSIDSRTILDMNGAEKLLGRGDMFYFPTGDKTPLRVQGCFVSDAEINSVVEYIAQNSDTDYNERIHEIMEAPKPGDADDADAEEDGGRDERLQEAVEMVLGDGQASISMLQRRMKIGYARAGRLIDDMALRGIVSRSAGSKPREVLITYEQYLAQKETYLR